MASIVLYWWILHCFMLGCFFSMANCVSHITKNNVERILSLTQKEKTRDRQQGARFFSPCG